MAAEPSGRSSNLGVFTMYCRERALQGDGHLMAIREPEFHGQLLFENQLRALNEQVRSGERVLLPRAPRMKQRKRRKR